MTTAATITELSLTAALAGPRPVLDPRSFIATPGCVDIALAGSIAAARYVAPALRTCRVPRAAMRRFGDPSAVAVSELLFGEDFALFDSVGDWGFGRSIHDGYTGWIALDALGDTSVADRQSVTARAAPVFAAADIKAPIVAELPFGAQVSGVAEGSFVALGSGGWLHRRHLERVPASPLAVAERFFGAPYLWGGRTPLGVDCSGLVQAVLRTCDIDCPRDSDQQRDAIGVAVDFADRAGGDIIFFPGHVGILIDADTLLHANAHWMAVVTEPLADVIARLADTPQPVAGVRRIG